MLINALFSDSRVAKAWLDQTAIKLADRLAERARISRDLAGRLVRLFYESMKIRHRTIYERFTPEDAFPTPQHAAASLATSSLLLGDPDALHLTAINVDVVRSFAVAAYHRYQRYALERGLTPLPPTHPWRGIECDWDDEAPPAASDAAQAQDGADASPAASGGDSGEEWSAESSDVGAAEEADASSGFKRSRRR